jgi:ppGpp synthetase/RelA/SpoT-type nucleotidyltranferase
MGKPVLNTRLRETDKDFLARQVAVYSERRSLYEAFKKILTAIFQKALKDLNIHAIVESHGKELPSFVGKIVRKHDKYQDPVNQITDFCGIRIILNNKDEIRHIANFVKRSFYVDESNSEDVIKRLGVGEFGYRSIHFVVSLKEGEFEELFGSIASAMPSKEAQDSFKASLETLFERRSEEECRSMNLPAGPKYKAEIQIRTLLQHAWAVFNHDRIYKSEFTVPETWQRDARRIAAALEEADEAIARTIRGVESYRNYYGAYMPEEKRRHELAKLELVQEYDPENMKLAHRSARLAFSLEEWSLGRDRLEPFIKQWEKALHRYTTPIFRELVTTQGKAIRWINTVFCLKEGETFDWNELCLEKSITRKDLVEIASRERERLESKNMSELFLDYGKAKWHSGEKSEGRDYMKLAVLLDTSNMHARVTLASSYEEEDFTVAVDCYEEVFRDAPSDPGVVRGLVCCRIKKDGNAEVIKMIRPSIEAAVQKCQEWAEVKVYLPMAYYDMGFFHLLLGHPYESLISYAKALLLTDSDNMIEKHSAFINDLATSLKGELKGLEWIRLFFIIGRAAWLLQSIDRVRAALADRENYNSDDENESNDLCALKEKERRYVQKAEEAMEKVSALRSKDAPPFTTPMVIVAGGTDLSVEQKIKEYKGLLDVAFNGFDGTIHSGGTEAGICGLIGDLPGKMKKVSCMPEHIPPWTRIHKAFEIYYSDGDGFSPLEPLQTWIDIMSAGAHPSDVKLLGINGGGISAVEYRLALALGASAGIVRESGRAATQLFEDREWNETPGLFFLPTDPQTVKVFIQGIAPASSLDRQHREALAKAMHEEYRSKEKKSRLENDPVLAEWDELREDYRASNFSHIDHIEDKLKTIGMMIRKVEHGSSRLVQFTDSQLELLSEMEHGRWNVERLKSGWRLGAKNAEEKTTPYLVPWNELSEKIRDYDRDFVRTIPERLALVGYEIVEA